MTTLAGPLGYWRHSIPGPITDTETTTHHRKRSQIQLHHTADLSDHSGTIDESGQYDILDWTFLHRGTYLERNRILIILNQLCIQ